MLGLFATDKGVSIAEADSDLTRPPEFTKHPFGGSTRFRLVGIDAVLVEGNAELVAFYEKPRATLWELGTRKEGRGEDVNHAG